MYKCVKCGEEFNELPKGLVRCPNCAYKIVVKTRDPIAKDIKAR
ncbi:MAG: DNA-directed RNA polymerase subunit P [Candidatus Diapherotrites archaeon]